MNTNRSDSLHRGPSQRPEPHVVHVQSETAPTALALAVVANRTRHNTSSLTKLMRFLTSLQIPIVAVLRDSQNYVYAADLGMGIYEMPRHRVKADVEQMDLIINWLDQLPMRRREAEPISRLEPRPEATIKPLH